MVKPKEKLKVGDRLVQYHNEPHVPQKYRKKVVLVVMRIGRTNAYAKRLQGRVLVSPEATINMETLHATTTSQVVYGKFEINEGEKNASN